MNSKTFSLFALSVLSLVLVMGLTSATVSVTPLNSTIFTIDNTNAAITGATNTVTVSFQLQNDNTGNFTNLQLLPINFTSTTGTTNSFLATPSLDSNFPSSLLTGIIATFSLTILNT